MEESAFEALKIDSFPHIPQGVLNIHSDIEAQSPADSLEVAAEKSRAITERLRKIIDEEAILAWGVRKPPGEIPNHGNVIAAPKAPYTDRALMLMYFPPDYDKQVSTKTIYDYGDLRVVAGYWRRIVAGLAAMRELTKEELDRFIPLYVENVVCRVTDKEVRTSRTAILPHGQWVEIDKNEIVSVNKRISHLQEEQDVLQRRKTAERFIERLKVEMREQVIIPGGYFTENTKADLSDVTIGVRDESPYGYFIQIPYSFNPEGLDRDEMAKIVTVAVAHHKAYTKLSQRYLSKATSVIPKLILIPQPSYRMYVSLGKENLTMVFTPEFISHAGVMEAAGIVVNRPPKIPRRYSEEEVSNFQKRFTELVETQYVQVRPTDYFDNF